MGGEDDGAQQKKPPETASEDFGRLDLSDQQFPLPTEWAVGQERLYAEAYRELALLVTGKEPSDTPPPEWEFREKVLAFLNENREAYHQKICIEFEYCKKKERFENGTNFLAALISLIGVLTDVLACGVASPLWLMSAAVLDEFCRCGKPQEQTA